MLLSDPAFVTDAAVPRTRQAQWNVHGSGIWIRQLQGERNKDERKQKSVPRNKAAALTEISTFYSLLQAHPAPQPAPLGLAAHP